MLGISMLFASFAAYRENKSTMCIVAFPVFLAFSIYPFVPDAVVYCSEGIPLLIVGAIFSFKAAAGLLGPVSPGNPESDEADDLDI